MFWPLVPYSFVKIYMRDKKETNKKFFNAIESSLAMGLTCQGQLYFSNL